ncbi:hypothetical protein QMN62_27165, partial [Escherichia coli]
LVSGLGDVYKRQVPEAQGHLNVPVSAILAGYYSLALSDLSSFFTITLDQVYYFATTLLCYAVWL